MDSARYNTLSSAELKRRGVAAIEQALQQRAQQAGTRADGSAVRWLLELPIANSSRSKEEIDAALAEERDW